MLKFKTEWLLRSVVKINNKGIRPPQQEKQTEIQDKKIAVASVTIGAKHN